ncbi:hypothetical protein OBO34_21815 [Clostridiales Family XIII bacterium ASD5510]|uniref:Uncharacterized protein n=1 Tax=Hominibacterium faecale TaxID=2839743 RepID=A0A9J6QZS4_9FIRM|nr:hypothetical protein [Hominibacterium faecale]MCU7380956.1 hypothetical protein [Hominibacterium faecale]
MSYTRDQMIAIFNRLQQSLIDRVADTGWMNLRISTYNVVFASGRIMVRKVGKVVTISVLNIRSESQLSAGSSYRILDELPAGCCPTDTVAVAAMAVPGSGLMFGGEIEIRPDGVVTLHLPAGIGYAPSYGIYATITYLTD